MSQEPAEDRTKNEDGRSGTPEGHTEPGGPGEGEAGVPGADRLPTSLGPYRVLGEIGRGGMGVVYLAEHTELRRKVALKVLSSHFGASERAYARFEREVRTVARLQHPRIVQVYELGKLEGSPYFTMEPVDGCTLYEQIASLRNGKFSFNDLRPEHLRPGPGAVGRFLDSDAPKVDRGPGSPTEAPGSDPGTAGDGTTTSGPKSYLEAACRLVLDVAEGLQHAHDHGVIHRDVKPNNILIRRDGRALLFDFGLAKVDTEQSLTLTGEFVGTPHYVSPEQAQPRGEDLDGRCDVFSLGVTLYELLTLRLPFRGGTPHEVFRQVAHAEPRSPRRINPLVPRDLETVCLTAMEKDRARRYQSPAELAQDLRRFLQWKPVLARPVGPTTRVLRWVRRNAAVSAFTVLGTMLLVALLIVGWQFLSNRVAREEKQRAQAASAASNFKSAQMLAQRGQWDDALVAYRQAADLGHDAVAVGIGRIEVFEGAGDLAAAAAELKAVLARSDLDQHRAKVWLLEADLGVSRRVQPNRGLNLVRKALALGGLDDADEAYANALLAEDLPTVLEQLRRTLAKQRFHRRALESLPPVLISLGHHEQGLEEARNMGRLYPDDPYPVLLEVVVLCLMGDLENAGLRLEEGRRRLDPDCADLDAWAVDLAGSRRLQEDLLAELTTGGRQSFRRSAANQPAALFWQLLQSPARILPGVPRGADDPGAYVIEFRMPPALARSYLPLTEALGWVGAAQTGPMTRDHVQAVERVLTNSLDQQPDGFRSFLRGLCRYNLRRGNRAQRLDACEKDFLAAVATPSMIKIDKAASFYALEVQKLCWRMAKDATVRSRAVALMQGLVDRDGLDAMQFRYLVRSAIEFEELDLAEEAALRWRRVHQEGPSSTVALAEIAFRRGRHQRAVELADQILSKSPQNRAARQWRVRASAAISGSKSPSPRRKGQKKGQKKGQGQKKGHGKSKGQDGVKGKSKRNRKVPDSGAAAMGGAVAGSVACR